MGGVGGHENVPEPIGQGRYQVGIEALEPDRLETTGVGGEVVNPVTPGLKTKIPGKEKSPIGLTSETVILHF